MIRVNDRLDPMVGLVEIGGAIPVDAPSGKRAFSAPQGEFTARLTSAGANFDRFSVMFGDPDAAEEGQAPDVWLGVVESWQPSGSNVLVICRPARNVEEGSGVLMSTSSSAIRPRVGGIG